MGSLELRDVVRHYTSGTETVRAVDSVSLHVAPGEFVALYGPSGSGKTTLLLLAAGLSTPDKGSVSFGGRDIWSMSAAQRDTFRRQDVGFVFQSFHLVPGASALSNAALKLLASGFTLRAAKREVLPWLERVGLSSRINHIPEQLSMGEQQRVAIARALVNEPGLLLADEPTGSLDSKRSNEILGLLRDVCHERHIPGLIVTHDQQALAFVDRVHSLRDGRLTHGLDAELAGAWSNA
jgi:putative ABC transport system ATP-binding protein